MTDDRTRPGDNDEEAWFSPSGEHTLPPAPPRGVRYGAPVPASQAGGEGDDLWHLEDPSQPLATPPRSGFRPFLVGLIAGVGLTVISVVGFNLFSPDDGGEPDPTVAGPAATSTTTTVPGTQAPPATVTTTTLAATTSTVTGPPQIDPVGNPLAISDLRLAADAIGPITIGTAAPEALGRLVASLGPPDEDTGTIVSDGRFGACAGDPVRIVRWGPLAVIVEQPDGGAVFAAYRLDLALGGLDSRAATISTLSGLRAGDSISDLETIYSSFSIEYLEQPGIGLIFELRRTGESAVLLRGPITSADPSGSVTGIFSPDACA